MTATPMRPTMVRRLWHGATPGPVVAVAMVVGLALMVAAIFVPLLVDVDVNASNLSKRLAPPSWAGGNGGLFGADPLGRDVALRILHGLRTSYAVGILAVLLGASIGTLAGVVAGYVGGWWDTVIMRLADVQMSLPSLLFAMVLIGLFGGGRASILIIVLGLNSWMLYARVLRGAVLSMRTSDLTLATVGLGATARRVLARHILPNSLAPLFALGAMEFARLMLAEASLSFLGFGIAAPQVSLGAILAEGRSHLNTSWWVAAFSGIFLALAVVSTNLIASWAEDAVDVTRHKTER